MITLLPDLLTLKIHSLLIEEKKFILKKYVLCSMKNRNKITKVYLEIIDDIQELDFLFTLCPYMEYLKVGCINIMDVQSFLCIIFKKINHHLRSLCFDIPTADGEKVENIEEIIKYEKIFDFTVKHPWTIIPTVGNGVLNGYKPVYYGTNFHRISP